MIENKEKLKLEKEILLTLNIVKKLILILIIIIGNFVLVSLMQMIIPNNSNTQLRTSERFDNKKFTFNNTEYYDFNNQINEITTFYNCKENFDDNLIERTNYTDFENEVIGNQKEEIEFIKIFTGVPAEIGINAEIQDFSGNKALVLSDLSNLNRLQISSEFFKDIVDFNFELHFTISKTFEDCFFAFSIDDNTNEVISVLFSGNHVYTYNGSHWNNFTQGIFLSGGIYECSIVDIDIANNNATFIFEGISYEIYLYEPYIDGFDQVSFITNIANTNTVIIFFDFFINGYQDSKIVFDFRNISDPFPLLFYDYTYLLFNISGNIEIWNYNESLYHLPNKRRSLTDWSYYSNNKNVFNCLSSINDNDKNIVVIKFYSQNISVIELKMFGYVFLSNALYYGAITPNLVEVNNIYGIQSSRIENDNSEFMSLNYFYINSSNKRLYFNVDFIDNNVNYLAFEIKLLDKISYHKYTWIRFNSERAPSLISNSYLIFSHWGTYGYYNQSISLPSVFTTQQVQLFSDEKTDDSFEFIYFNCSDISDNSFTGYSVNGYISEFEVQYFTIITYETLLFLEILAPLLVFVGIPMILVGKLGKNYFNILCLLSSLILYIASIIPLWLFFVMLSSFGMSILLAEKERGYNE